MTNQPTASGVSEEMLTAAMDEARITGSVSMVPRARMLRILEAALSAKPAQMEPDKDEEITALRHHIAELEQPIPTPDEALREILADEMDREVYGQPCGKSHRVRGEGSNGDVPISVALAAMSRVATLSRARPEEANQDEALVDYVLVPRVALQWLEGSGPDDQGRWFGECDDCVKDASRRYWWRRHFRKIRGRLSSAALHPATKTGET